jgi:pimeloyl-ACP methyl ester carboxylesterase
MKTNVKPQLDRHKELAGKVCSPAFEIPFYVLQGEYDYQVSYSLAKEYLDIIKATGKYFFTFNNSAHSPNMEESEKFVRIIRRIKGVASLIPALEAYDNAK